MRGIICGPWWSIDVRPGLFLRSQISCRRASLAIRQKRIRIGRIGCCVRLEILPASEALPICIFVYNVSKRSNGGVLRQKLISKRYWEPSHTRLIGSNSTASLPNWKKVSKWRTRFAKRSARPEQICSFAFRSHRRKLARTIDVCSFAAVDMIRFGSETRNNGTQRFSSNAICGKAVGRYLLVLSRLYVYSRSFVNCRYSIWERISSVVRATG